jgi:uroporphyrinogen-III synthase
MSALAGKRVVVTRAAHQAEELAALLRERGAIPLLYPCIEILPPEDTSEFDAALRSAASSEFDWLVLTSANTVSVLAYRLSALDISPDALGNLRVAAVGAATAEAARKQIGVEITTVPESYQADALADTMGSVQGARMLLPQSGLADDTLKTDLVQRGAKVISVEAYRTGIGSGGVDVPALLDEGKIDAVTFTSASTVANFLARIAGNRLPENVCIACIGGKTAAQAFARGLNVQVIPTRHTLESLVTALEMHFTGAHDIDRA